MARKLGNRRINNLSVRALKKKYGDVPTHFLFSIKTPLEYQCPIIDHNIDKVVNCKDKLHKAFNAKSIESKNALISAALFAISDLEKNLDEVTRNNFIELREYAKEWKKLAIEVLDASGHPEKFVKIKWR